MNPSVRRNLPLFGKPDHVHRRRVSGRLARAAFERRFQFPDRRIARPPDRVERQAGARFAAMAHHLQPAISAIEALCDRGRRLRGSDKAFHLFRPQQAFGGVRLTHRLPGFFACMLRADPRAPDAIAKDSLSAAASHWAISPAFAEPRNTTSSGGQERPPNPTAAVPRRDAYSCNVWFTAGAGSAARRSTSRMTSLRCLGASFKKALRSRRLSTASPDGAPSFIRTSGSNVGFFISHLR